MIRVKLTKAENLRHYNKSIVTLPLEEYLRGVVPSEIKAGYTHMEAIKAQVVAARTFALNKILHPRDEAFDLYDNVNDQSYNVTTIHPRTDEAIKATAGEMLYYDGKLIDTPAYSNSNHGWTVPAEVEWHNPRPYLKRKYDPFDRMYRWYKCKGHGVGMSQVGANELAKLGALYREILAFYYQGIQLYHMDAQELEDLMEVLRKGCKGEAVKKMQQTLIEKGCDLGRWGADGDFGRTTERAVKEFQKKHGLNQTGIFDEATAKVLYGVDELTKVTMTIQEHLRSENYALEAEGEYNLETALALVELLGIELEEEPSEPPKPTPTPQPKPGSPPQTAHFKMVEWNGNRWIGDWHTFTKLSDWRCEHGVVEPPVELWPNLQKLMDRLEILREIVGNRVITIKCGYRPQDYNDGLYVKSQKYLQGGVAKHSPHIQCLAADITVVGLNSAEVYKIADEVFSDGGCHAYRGFVHVDVRGHHARW